MSCLCLRFYDQVGNEVGAADLFELTIEQARKVLVDDTQNMNHEECIKRYLEVVNEICPSIGKVSMAECERVKFNFLAKRYESHIPRWSLF